MNDSVGNFPGFFLGTAQFGIPSYGIANRVGQPPYAALREIVRRAFEVGAVGLDTAAAVRLGKAKTSWDGSWRS